MHRGHHSSSNCITNAQKYFICSIGYCKSPMKLKFLNSFESHLKKSTLFEISGKGYIFSSPFYLIIVSVLVREITYSLF